MKIYINSSIFLIFIIFIFSLSACKVGEDEVIIISEGTEESETLDNLTQYFTNSKVYVSFYRSDGTLDGRLTWCREINSCDCGLGSSQINYTSILFDADINGSYPPFSYFWEIDGQKYNTDNVSVSVYSGTMIIKLLIVDSLANSIYASDTSCSRGDNMMYINMP